MTEADRLLNNIF